MKIHSSKKVLDPELSAEKDFDIKKYELRELNSREVQLQEMIDRLHEKRKKIEVKQDSLSSGFKVDKSVEESYPKAKEEIRQFEDKVEKEVAKRIGEIEKKAYADGFLKAKEEGYEKGLKDVQEKVEPFIDEIKSLLECLRKIREEMVIKNEKILTNIMIMCIEKIILSSYTKDLKVLRSMLFGMVKITGEREDIELHLNKYDYDRIVEFSKELADELGMKNGIRLDIDPSIKKGGCKVVSNLGVIDATLEEQFKNLRQNFEQRIPKPDSNFVEEKKNEIKDNGEINKKAETKDLPKDRVIKKINSEDVAKVVKTRITKDE